ncbi:heavy metal translocating P-type ATPase [Halobacteriales archaeon Cl-PHB]
MSDASRPAPGTTGDEATDGCTLCDLPVPAEPITDPDVEGTFCCRGCLEVHRALGDLEDDELPEDPLSATTPDPDDVEGEEAFFAVDGMHCATCETFLESVAAGTDGVEAAEASYATDTVRLAYDPDVVDRETLPGVLTTAGYTARDREESGETPPSAELAKFLIGGGLFGMMVMVWYVLFLYPTYLGYEPLVSLGGLDGLYLFGNVWLLTSLVLFYTGFPILRGAYVSLRAGQPNMDLLVSLAAGGAYAYSSLAMVLGETHLYFDVSVAIVLVVTAGNWWESRIKRRATGLLSDLTELQVEDARLAADGETVPVDTVTSGQRLLVKPGERVPLDGEVVEGRAAVDESLVTGESVPVTRQAGDAVRGGTVVTDAPLVVEVGDDPESTLDRVVSLLWRIQSSRSGVQRLADRLATVFVPLVVAIATVTGLVLLATGASPTAALLTGLTVLIVSCPCALGLATPLAVAAGLETGADRGIVVASDELFETAPEVDTVALDKTGTLTSGEMTVRRVEADDEATVMRRAAAIERLSSHPIGAAIAAAGDGPSESVAAADGGAPATETPVDAESESTAGVEDFEAMDRGVAGTVDGDRVLVGHPDEFDDEGWPVADRYATAAAEARADGDVPVLVGWAGVVRGLVVVGDEPRAGWESVVERLSAGHRVVVITGDEGRAAERFRDHFAIDEVFAGVPPEAKAETVARLRQDGTVAMVGDGSNDAPALATADVGIALQSGTKLATDAADAILLRDRLADVPAVFDLASATNRRIRQNLGWAFLYNLVAIPLAALGLLNPLFAAGAMAASSTLVVLNSTRSLSLDGE